jgi:hypothetical protein
VRRRVDAQSHGTASRGREPLTPEQVAKEYTVLEAMPSISPPFSAELLGASFVHLRRPISGRRPTTSRQVALGLLGGLVKH